MRSVPSQEPLVILDGVPVSYSWWASRTQNRHFDLLSYWAKNAWVQTGWRVKYRTSQGNVNRRYSIEQTEEMLGGLEGGETVSPIYQSTWAINWSLIPYQTGRPAPLNDEENSNLDTRIQKLIDDRLGRDHCRKFLEDKLGSDAYRKLVETLKNQSLRYSAERSTDITVEQAGLYGPNARRVLSILADKKHTKDSIERQKYQDRLDSLDWSVSKWSRRNPIHAVLGNINGQEVIFYASFKKITTIVHENLHISTGKNDVDLANALGLKDASGNQFKEGDTKKASRGN